MIAITADHHYHPYAAFAVTDGRGVNSRFAEMLAVERWLDPLFRRHKVRTHIRLGDLFDRKNQIDAVVYAEIADVLATRARHGTQEILIKGNHDVAAGGVRTSLEGLVHLHANVRVIADRTSYRHGDTRFTVIPHMERWEDTSEWLLTQLGPEPHQVLLGHCQIDGAKSGTEYRLPGSVTLEDLHLDRFRVAFFGHVHEPQQLAPNAYYVGSFCQRSFADVGSARRLVLYDSMVGTWKFVPLPGPRFYQLHVHTPEDLQKIHPKAGSYYHVVLAPSIPFKLVDAMFDGHACQWIISHAPTPQEAATAPRIPATATRWDDICAQYQELVPGPGEPLELRQLADELRTDGLGS